MTAWRLWRRRSARDGGRDWSPMTDLIEERLRHWADTRSASWSDNGRHRLPPSDLTPEATPAVIERRPRGSPKRCAGVPGAHPPLDALAGVAGIRGATLIINFPGNPESISQAGEAITDALPHALNLIAGRPDPHPPGDESHGAEGTGTDQSAAAGEVT